MYSLRVLYEDTEFTQVTRFIEFENLAAVFIMVDMFEKHSKYACSYKIEFIK